MKSNWKKLSNKTVFNDNILSVRHADYSYSPVDDKMTFTLVDISSWVLIVPVADNGDFFIVKQFRAGSESDTLEFPGGAIDFGESHESASKRELLEETGITSDNIQLLGTMYPNPAFLCNKCYVYLAKNAKITSEPMRDKFEDTEVVRVSNIELKNMINNGEFNQSISLAGYALMLNNL